MFTNCSQNCYCIIYKSFKLSVGHIVGLGDRHVQNILIDKAISEIIHIDLGVAFDQVCHFLVRLVPNLLRRAVLKFVFFKEIFCVMPNSPRASYSLHHISEIVPFHLTRDLVDGLGITGTEGVFRRSCEYVMKVLQVQFGLFSYFLSNFFIQTT